MYNLFTPSKYVRRVANHTGFAFLIGQTAVEIILTAVALVLVLTKGYAVGMSLFASAEFTVVVQAVGSLLICIPPFIIATKTLGFRMKSLISFKIEDGSFAFALMLFSFGVIVLANVVSSVITILFENAGYSPEGFDLEVPKSPLGILFYLFTVCVVPAVGEEFALRGVIQGSLRPLGDKTAIVITATFFALMHGNFVQIPFAFIMGLILGYLTAMTKSIIPAVIIHLINNLISGVISIMLEMYSESFVLAVYYFIFGVMFILGVIGAVLLCTRHFYKVNGFRPASLQISLAKAFSVFYFTSPAMIINILLFGGIAVYDLFR